ncbi:type II toxin-antitoxin system MqsR family toxin [Pluralibacter sp.]|uniref:type II toxin-antitoxin system MqsR family toxin n=1 Tax=Pluralibacter sp. TaxID=1920032 RepID=UPI0025E52457|nr:type II toxin-antitoxin system MqsR family toxin [Pluralibacter sp.]MBV8044935.1 type II toxin-antitoxin system MqsR family toxin [Pluralibacter sp.]
MEKRTPHVRLRAIKSLVNSGKIRATHSAILAADALGFDFTGMCEVVLALSEKDFYKSMTTYADHSLWQDVYRPYLHCGQIYLKVTVEEDALIVSFKEK